MDKAQGLLYLCQPLLLAQSLQLTAVRSPPPHTHTPGRLILLYTRGYAKGRDCDLSAVCPLLRV